MRLLGGGSAMLPALMLSAADVSPARLARVLPRESLGRVVFARSIARAVENGTLAFAAVEFSIHATFLPALLPHQPGGLHNALVVASLIVATPSALWIRARNGFRTGVTGAFASAITLAITGVSLAAVLSLIIRAGHVLPALALLIATGMMSWALYHRGLSRLFVRADLSVPQQG
jgi:hypothetical protein